MKLPLLILFLANHAFAQSTILWTEAVNGQLSNSLNPIHVGNLQLGTNLMFGSTTIQKTGPGWFLDGDYFNFRVPAGVQVVSVQISVNKPTVSAWIGPNFSTQLAYTLPVANGELLTQWLLGQLSSGNYSMYLENLDFIPDVSIADYTLGFVVTPVPEPSAVQFVLIGVAAFLAQQLWQAASRLTKK